MWASAILGALKALPELVGVIRDLGAMIGRMQDTSIDRKVDKIKADLNEVMAKVKHEEDRQKLLDLARQLNASRRGEL